MTSIGIITATFNEEITAVMKKEALLCADEYELKVVACIDVPGVLDLPLPAQQLLSRKDIDAVVVLGFVRKGETDHDQLVAHQSVRALVDVSLSYKKPIGFGIIGPNATFDQARLRAESYAKHAVGTVISLCSLKMY